MASVILKNCRFVVTQNKKREILENVDIEIEDNKIKKIGKNLKGKNAETIDCSNKIVLPGLINTHTHIGMHSLRGICDDEELPAWLDKVVAAEKKFTHAQIERNASQACEEMLLSGTTTFVEMYTPLLPVIAGVQNCQIRAVLCPVIYGFLGEVKQQLEEAKKLIDAFTHPLITLGLAGHSIYTCDKETLIAIKEYAKTKNLLTPIHIAETRKERFDCFDKHKKLPIEYLAEIGYLDKRTVLVHSIWLTKGEVRIIAQYNASVAHCPVSNMKLSSGGVSPLMEMFEEHVAVGLGTDSVASNNSMDMFKEMMICGLLHKQHRWDPKAAPVQKLLDMATIEGAQAIGREKEIGSLEEGKKADIIAVAIGANHWPLSKENFAKSNFLTSDAKFSKRILPPNGIYAKFSKERVVSHLVYATNGNAVADVVVDGKVAVRERKIVG